MNNYHKKKLQHGIKNQAYLNFWMGAFLNITIFLLDYMQMSFVKCQVSTK